MIGPYGETAWLYWGAGWRGVIPLPAHKKSPPPHGYTGWAGVEPSGADVQAWCDGPEAAGNIGLRLPHGVYGLDVDAYGTKHGGRSLRNAEATLGALPATWLITSRDDNVSGIRLFRAALDAGRRWKDEPAGHGNGIEAIHFGHRYAVAWPSVHPDTGRKYLLYRPDGTIAGAHQLPAPDDLPDLATVWIDALSEPGEVATGESASHGDTLAAVEAFPTGTACDRIAEARERAVTRLSQARDGAALHPAGRDGVHELVRLGHEGHSGARKALAEHYGAFVDVRVGRGGAQREAEAEWWRLTRGAVGKLTGSPADGCDCALLTGEGLLFEYSSTSSTQSIPAPRTPDHDQDSSVDQTSGGEGGVGGMLAELRTPAQLDALPNPVPLVAGLLDLDTLAWLIGKSGSFKSFIALDLAAHVGAGRPWAHRRVRAGQVLYVAAEGGRGMKLRKRAWEAHSGELMAESVRFLTRPVQAKGEEWAVLLKMASIIRPSLIVIDTQARISIGIEENSNTDMGKLVEQLDRLRRASGACVLTVHHIGRNGEDARGASSIDGAQDTELKVERGRGMAARLVVDKQKDGADTNVVDFEMVRMDGGVDPVTERDLSSLAVRITSELFAAPPARPWVADLTANQALIMEIIFESFSERGGSAGEVAGVWRERKNNVGAPGGLKFSRSSFYAAWNALQQKDRIERVHGSQRFVPILSDAGATD